MKKWVLIFLLLSSPCIAGVEFDNTDDYIDTNYTPAFSATDDFSICGWFDIDNAGTAEEYITGYISHSVQQDGLIQIGVGSTAQCSGTAGLELLVYIRDDDGNLSTPADGLCSTTDITVNTPHSFCLTYDDDAGPLGTLYMDGVSVATDTTVDAVGAKNAAFPREFFIGARNSEGSPDSFWDGDIYEIAYWDNVVLSSVEVSQYHSYLRRTPCQLQPSALIKYMPLDDVAEGASADGQSFRAECGTSLTAGTGVDGANNTGLTSVSKALSYP